MWNYLITWCLISYNIAPCPEDKAMATLTPMEERSSKHKCNKKHYTTIKNCEYKKVFDFNNGGREAAKGYMKSFKDAQKNSDGNTEHFESIKMDSILVN